MATKDGFLWLAFETHTIQAGKKKNIWRQKCEATSSKYFSRGPSN